LRGGVDIGVKKVLKRCLGENKILSYKLKGPRPNPPEEKSKKRHWWRKGGEENT